MRHEHVDLECATRQASHTLSIHSFLLFHQHHHHQFSPHIFSVPTYFDNICIYLLTYLMFVVRRLQFYLFSHSYDVYRHSSHFLVPLSHHHVLCQVQEEHE